MADEGFSTVSMGERQKYWAKDVQVTLPWERFKRLSLEGTLDETELSQLNDEGRIAFIDNFKPGNTQKDEGVEIKYVRPRPKYLPGTEQRGKKRPRGKPTSQPSEAGAGHSNKKHEVMSPQHARFPIGVHKMQSLVPSPPLPIGSSRHIESRCSSR